ncbi:MAG: hypothetical protein ACJAUG_002027 [Halioglobus sp.]|jgi:hypothetical protein
MKNTLSLLVTLLLLHPHNATAQRVAFESTAAQVGLLELYTSEGCSSCPPAEEWLSKLKQHPGVWSKFIPIALHVDYWDYIGWEDRFASPSYAKRQRQYAKEKSLTAVYTPGFVYNGTESRKWYTSRKVNFPEGDSPGVLRLEVDGSEAQIDFAPTQELGKQLQVNIAILGFDLETQVRAGENRGKTLPHDFVVLGIKQSTATWQKDGYSTIVTLPTPSQEALQYGVVAWVSSPGKQLSIQAVGGLLP